jgi:hypothetical protein
MPAKPKVYVANLDGVHQWIVAAPNQAAALKAWGVSQNLFQQGRAKVADEPRAVQAALADAGQPLRRLAGSKGAFVRVAAEGDLSGWQAAAKAVGAKRGSAKPRLSRRALDAAEACLADFEAAAKSRRAAIDKKRQALDVQAARLEQDLGVRRDELADAVKNARLDFER